jgi:uncharacterized protein DUF6399
MPCEDATLVEAQTQQGRWDRGEAAERLQLFEVKASEGQSQRDFARHSGTPRTTLQGWLDRKRQLELEREVAALLESPAGLRFVHRIVEAARLAFTQAGPCGIRSMCLFLQLSQLDEVVGSSYGAQQKASCAMESQIVEYEREQRRALAPQMPRRSICLCEDETFHPQTCLVAIEPVSGFIVVERYSERRDAPSWNTAIAEGTADLSVDVVQVTSDQARGILAHVRCGLGAHAGPDLFHVQREVSQATALRLSAQVRQCAEALTKARGEVEEQFERREAYRRGPRPRGHPPDFDGRIARARGAEDMARVQLQAAEERRATAKAALRGLGDSYHPFDLESGVVRDGAVLEAELKEHLEHIEKVASEAVLPQASRDKLASVRPLLAVLAATVIFFHQRVSLWIASLLLEPDVEAVVRTSLIPGLYLARVAPQAPSTERRAALRRSSAALLARARAPDSALSPLEPERRRHIEQTAQRCAELFVRSSSCVEGRNGQLSLRHHGLHRLSDRKLRVLTILHNYFIRRRDRTTAAERFFGSPPVDLFEWLLPRLPLPVRPARSPSKPRRQAA